jgi:hypothetical protein
MKAESKTGELYGVAVLAVSIAAIAGVVPLLWL